jgi:hypothetical protein
MPPPKLGLDSPPKTEPCRVILDYWQTLRGDRLRPRRAEIDPGALRRYLPHVGLFQVQTPEFTLCRLAGSAFRLSLGFELTGRNVVHLYAPELHRAAGYRFYMMATQPCAAMLELPLKFSSGLEHPHEILILPLEPEGQGGPVVLLVGMAGVDAVNWQNAAVLPQLHPSATFRFVDIGAGVPTASMPPEDFNPGP